MGWLDPGGPGCELSGRFSRGTTLKITLREALKFNKQDALNAAGSNFHEEKIAL